MIPAPLSAPPTGITDAGYKVWLGAFVCTGRKRRTRLRARLRTGRLPNAQPAFAQGFRLRIKLRRDKTAWQALNFESRSPAAAGKLSRRRTSTLNVHSNRPADDHKTESGKFRLLALRN